MGTRNNTKKVASGSSCPPLKCKFCSYMTSMKAGYYVSNRRQILNNHVSSVHDKPRPFKCNQCEYTTKRKGTLKVHQVCCKRQKANESKQRSIERKFLKPQ